MRIVVTHLTRMQPGFVCVAGVDLDTRRHVRPELASLQRIRVDLLVRNGGPFGMASVVDLGQAIHVGQPPEVEDYLFEPEHTARMGTASGDSFWRLLQSVAKSNLADIFGPDLMTNGRSCIVEVGRGIASLGCLRPAAKPVVEITPRNRLRLHVGDGEIHAELSLADLRFYEQDHQTIRRDVVHGVTARIRKGVPVLVCVGLTRPYPPDDPKHWLQANSLHLADDPTWPG